MSVPLPAELLEALDVLVSSGRFASRADALHEAVLLLMDREEASSEDTQSLRSAVQKGLESARAGRVRELTPGVIDEIIARGRAKLEASRRQSKSA